MADHRVQALQRVVRELLEHEGAEGFSKGLRERAEALLPAESERCAAWTAGSAYGGPHRCTKEANVRLSETEEGPKPLCPHHRRVAPSRLRLEP